MSIFFNYSRTLCAVTAIAAVTGAAWSTAPAFAAEPSWKGKVLKVIIRSSPGGGYDYYGRLMARYMPKYLPGKPTGRPVNMSGAGGIVAANYIYGRGAKDGSEIAVLSRGLAIAQVSKKKNVKYDVSKLTSIGSTTGATWVWVISGKHQIKSLTDLKKWKGPPIKFSASGRGATSYSYVKMLETDGYPVKVITGYDGNEEKSIALARGDVEATSGSYESLRRFIIEQKLTILGRMGNHPETLKSQQASDIASADGKAMIAFASAGDRAGRPFFAPPGLSPAITKALRTAFEKAMKDPDFIAETKKAKRGLSYVSGEEMEKLYAGVLGASPQVIAAFSAISKKPKKKAKTYKGEITALADRNKLVTMKRDNGKVLETKISGSRTAIMVAGQKVKRKALKVGMKCSVVAPGNKKEAKKVDCK